MITGWRDEVEPANATDKWIVMDKETPKEWHLAQSQVKKMFHEGVRNQLNQMLLEIE